MVLLYMLPQTIHTNSTKVTECTIVPPQLVNMFDVSPQKSLIVCSVPTTIKFTDKLLASLQSLHFILFLETYQCWLDITNSTFFSFDFFSHFQRILTIWINVKNRILLIIVFNSIQLEVILVAHVIRIILIIIIIILI